MQIPGGQFFTGVQGGVKHADVLKDLRIQHVFLLVYGQGKLVAEKILHAFGG